MSRGRLLQMPAPGPIRDSRGRAERKAKKPDARPPVAGGETPSVATAAPLAPAVPAANAPNNGPGSLSEVDRAIGTSLDALKEGLFRLELRHQAGTITEEDYARERAKAEKILRDLVRG